jgi:hypothetical protein
MKTLEELLLEEREAHWRLCECAIAKERATDRYNAALDAVSSARAAVDIALEDLQRQAASNAVGVNP